MGHTVLRAVGNRMGVLCNMQPLLRVPSVAQSEHLSSASSLSGSKLSGLPIKLAVLRQASQSHQSVITLVAQYQDRSSNRRSTQKGSYEQDRYSSSGYEEERRSSDRRSRPSRSSQPPRWDQQAPGSFRGSSRRRSERAREFPPVEVVLGDQYLQPRVEQRLQPRDNQRLQLREDQSLEPRENPRLQPRDYQRLQPRDDQRVQPRDDQRVQPRADQRLQPMADQRLEEEEEDEEGESDREEGLPVGWIEMTDTEGNKVLVQELPQELAGMSIQPKDLEWKPSNVELPGEIDDDEMFQMLGGPNLMGEGWQAPWRGDEDDDDDTSNDDDTSYDDDTIEQRLRRTEAVTSTSKHELEQTGPALSRQPAIPEKATSSSKVRDSKPDTDYQELTTDVDLEELTSELDLEELEQDLKIGAVGAGLLGNKSSKSSSLAPSNSTSWQVEEEFEPARPSSSKPARPAALAGTQRTNFDSSLARDFFSRDSFAKLGGSSEAVAALASIGITRPSHIQAKAFQSLLEGGDAILADQTGSGKTLAYLLPTVQRIRQQELEGRPRAGPFKPKALVLVPTAELGSQVLAVARSLSRGGMPYRSALVTGGFRLKHQVEALQEGVDVVIATPGRLLQLMQENTLKLDNVQTVIVDEVDVLFNDEDWGQFIHPLRSRLPELAQFVFVTATLPVDVHERLLNDFPFATSVLGPTLHKTATGLQEVLVDCSGGSEISEESAFLRKRDALLQIVAGARTSRGRGDESDEDWEGNRRHREAQKAQTAKKTIVFCNKIDTCRAVENALRREDRRGSRFEVLAHHAAIAPDRRSANFQRFMQPHPTKPLILVCTDRASRGLDSADVECVVLFDFPREPSEYVRRVGRTARGAGGTGTVYALVLGRQVALARRIMDRNEKGQPVHDVPASIY